LHSIDGKLNIPAALPDQAHRYKNTEALELCPYFKEVVDTFQCNKEAVRLMSLPPGAVISTHVDDFCGYEDGVFRVHVPILTHNEVYFILNDQRLLMKPGEAWYTNVNLPHSVANRGSEKRVHLVLDCIRNDWSDELFKKAGLRFELEKEEEEELPEETIKMMIHELEQHGSSTAQTMIEELKSKLN